MSGATHCSYGRRGVGVGPMIRRAALHVRHRRRSPVRCSSTVRWRGRVGLGPAAWVAAGAALLVAVVLLRRDEPAPGAHEQAEGRAPAPRRLLVMISVFFVLYVGVELGFSGWVYAYAQDLDIGGSNGAAWLHGDVLGLLRTRPADRHSPGGGRGAPLDALRRLHPDGGRGRGLLVVVGGGELVWVGTALLGIGLAPQFATMIAFAERHVAITGAATSWFIGAVAIGGFAPPWLIGQLFDRTGSSALPAAVLCSATATLGWSIVVARLFARRSAVPAERRRLHAAPGERPRARRLGRARLRAERPAAGRSVELQLTDVGGCVRVVLATAASWRRPHCSTSGPSRPCPVGHTDGRARGAASRATVDFGFGEAAR